MGCCCCKPTQSRQLDRVSPHIQAKSSGLNKTVLEASVETKDIKKEPTQSQHPPPPRSIGSESHRGSGRGQVRGSSRRPARGASPRPPPPPAMMMMRGGEHGPARGMGRGSIRGRSFSSRPLSFRAGTPGSVTKRAPPLDVPKAKREPEETSKAQEVSSASNTPPFTGDDEGGDKNDGGDENEGDAATAAEVETAAAEEEE